MEISSSLKSSNDLGYHCNDDECCTDTSLNAFNNSISLLLLTSNSLQPTAAAPDIYKIIFQPLAKVFKSGKGCLDWFGGLDRRAFLIIPCIDYVLFRPIGRKPYDACLRGTIVIPF